MFEIEPKTKKKLPALGVSAPAEVAPLFAALRAALADDLKTLLEADLRTRWLGRKQGLLRHVTENWLQPASGALKAEVGRQLNALRAEVEEALETARFAERMAATSAAGAAAAAAIDWTLPGAAARRGARHLITQTLEEIQDIFARIGFSVVEGPEVETDYYNFEALNIPEHHPARDMWDTLYLQAAAEAMPAELRGPRSDPKQRLLLRTHTSPVQIRVMEKQPPPVRILVPGKVYRHDNPTAGRSFMFHQVEGLAVDHDITFADLKGTLEFFLREFFGPETRTRFVPSFFPFTEPSADVIASCHVCSGSGCRTCKMTGWLELLGCGMVHPRVFEYVGYDPREVSGFAFGFGADRMAMVKYGVDTIQLFFQNDVRFLQQFR